LRSLPLYQDDLLAVEKVDPRAQNLSCRECGMGGSGAATCMFPRQSGKSDVMVVGESPATSYAHAGEPFAGGAELKVRRKILKYGKTVTFDYAVKCSGRPKDHSEVQCRPYLYRTFLDCSPERVILIGKTAQRAFLGRAYNATLVRKGYVTTYDGVPVFCLPDLYEVVDNKVLKRWFSEDLDWAMTDDTTLTPYDGVCRIVETVHDARTACEIIREHGVAAVDVETYGDMYGPEYKVVVLAAAYLGADSAWVWPEEAMVEPDPRLEPLRELLAEVPIAAHSADTEYRAIGRYFGVDVGLKYDTKASSKLMYPDGPADLDLVSAHVGMGGHKHEAAIDLAVKGKVLAGLRNAANKPVVTEWGIEIRIDKNGRKSRRNVPKETREPALSEQIEQIRVAWDKPRTINKQKDTYKNLANCELTEDWINAALSSSHVKTYTYGLMDRELCMRYCALDAVVCAKKVLRDDAIYAVKEMAPIRQTYHEIIIPITSVAARMMNNGLLIDQDALGTFESFLDDKISEYAAKIDEYCPGINPGSDDQVRKFLYEPKALGGLGLPILKKTKGGKTGTNKKPAVDGTTLGKLKDEHPVVELLASYAEVTKLQSNYARGLRPHIADDGRIHCYLNVTGAGTGRWTCSKPNMQTLPSRKQYSKMAKMLYVAPTGYKLVAHDFSTLEVRVAAHRSGDKVMLELLNTKDSRGNYLDFHLETAKGISPLVWGNSLQDCGFGYTFDSLRRELGSEEAAQADLRWKVLADEISRRRSVAKQINFSLIYGQGTDTLAERIGCSTDEAERAKEAILGRFKQFRDWMAAQVRAAHKDGGVWAMWHDRRSRFRHLPDVGYSDRVRQGHGERCAFNTPVQGEGSDFNTTALIEIDRWLKESDFDAQLVLAVHDSNLAEVREDLVEEYSRNVSRIMSDHPGYSVPILADADAGSAYGAMEKLVLAA
jgi:DNA polymerase I-like protein with 3'-5' exonuclease and polymerase domains/uracil-DNA glycosylase